MIAKRAKKILSEEKIKKLVRNEVSPYLLTEEEVRKKCSKYKLKKLANKLNKKYFNYSEDIMSPLIVKLDGRLTSSGGVCRSYRREIKISPKYIRKYPDQLENVLIHEMIHLKINNHGKDFYDEMKRINKLAGKKVVTRHTKEQSEIKYLTYCPKCDIISAHYSKLTSGLKYGNYYHKKCKTYVHTIEVEKYL
ncbi:MAG: SprT-like domain-containing protein [bacterium]